jgi:hypothetical protein
MSKWIMPLASVFVLGACGALGMGETAGGAGASSATGPVAAPARTPDAVIVVPGSAGAAGAAGSTSPGPGFSQPLPNPPGSGAGTFSAPGSEIPSSRGTPGTPAGDQPRGVVEPANK